ncbi:MoaD/ThiS family protein [Gelria sp. Kuro-4]|uniref:MoaD/ThiS family protein n=1 Tax=Gelria sp. Kuro-4 TaxID=2796927 RepID=UPI001BEF2343|nr:MoaD/ThiS family protein [Gelria sp. Kuro-4]BCV23558.1 hypothetical protein kuro4_03310 [Gelria sp. Kuro-4]
MLIHLPPGVDSDEREIVIEVTKGTSLAEALKLAGHRAPFVAQLIAGAGSTPEGTFLFILNGERVNLDQANHIHLCGNDQLYIVPPILGG